MDVTASLVSIVDAAWKVTQYLKDVKKGGSERQQLDGEILSIYHLFHGLRDQFSEENGQNDDAYLKPIRILLEPNGVIPQLRATLEELIVKLHKASQTQTGKIVQSFLWPFQKEDAKELIQRLDRLKTSVTLALAQVHTEQGRIGNLMISDIQLSVASQRLRDIIEWLSPLHFSTMKDLPLKKALPGTGRWFLEGDEFQVFKAGTAPVLWASGIPGAGKTCLAGAAFECLVADAGEKTAVLIAFCAFDVPKTHSATDMLWGLLRQLVEIKGSCSERIEKLYDASGYVQGQQVQSRPDVNELCKILGEEMSEYDDTFLLIDGLDEMPERGEREELLRRLEYLDPRPKLMVTSRPLGDIRTWFTENSAEDGYRVTQSDPSASAYCDICYSSTTCHYHCTNPICDFDICFQCYEDNKICGTCKGSSFELIYSGSVVIAARPEDIEQYVNSRIDGNNALKRLIARGKSGSAGKDLRSEVISKVKEDAQEMFLLARFHMDVIENETSPNGVRRALKTLPRGINETFDRTFERIERLGDVRRVMRLIAYVAYSNNVLTVQALNHAVAIEPEHTFLDEDDISYVDDLAPMCAGLVEIGPEPKRYVRLAHETIGRYISESQRALFSEKQRPLAIACLTYLRFSSFEDGACYSRLSSQQFEDRMSDYPFLEYAALHWGSHAQTCYNDDVVRSKTMSFLNSQAHVNNAAEVMWHGDHEDYSSWDAKDGVTGLHLASFFGLPHAVSELISQGADPDSQDCLNTTPLMYAASRERAEVVAVLLHAGARAAAVCGRGSTALHRAALSGYISVVGQLVTANQDIGINSLDSRHDNMTALMLSVWSGSADVVKSLLEHPDINANLLQPGPHGTNALLTAIHSAKMEILKVMLDSKKIDVDCQDRHGKTALIQAARFDRREVAEALLQHNADPSLTDEYGGPPFLRAVDYNSFDIVRLFLDSGVDYTFKDFLGRNVIHGASVCNRPHIMRLILEHAKKSGNMYLIHEKDNKGETPLFDSARRDHDECVKVLLEFGARTDVMNNSGKTPVWSAFEMGMQRIIPLLREYRNRELVASDQRVNDNMDEFGAPRRVDTFNSYKLSLHAAARRLDAIAFEAHLQTYGSELSGVINSKNDAGGQTPLHIAVQRYSQDVSDTVQIIKLLLASGAHIEEHDQWGWTPLHLAIGYDSTQIIEVLVAAGADVNSTDLLKRTPLDFAIIENFHINSAFFLVTHGASFDSNASSIVDLLSWAAFKGELAVVKVLVEKGVPTHLKDEDGLTPGQRATMEGFAEVAEVLLGRASPVPSIGKSIALEGSDSGGNVRPLVRETIREDNELEAEIGPAKPVEAVLDDVTKARVTLSQVGSVDQVTERASQEEIPSSGTNSSYVGFKTTADPQPSGAADHLGPLTTRELVLLACIVALLATVLMR